MQKWEYLRVAVRYENGGWSTFINNEGEINERTTDLTGLLNDLGERGWELVTAPISGNGATLFFKRPKIS